VTLYCACAYVQYLIQLGEKIPPNEQMVHDKVYCLEQKDSGWYLQTSAVGGQVGFICTQIEKK